MVVILSHCRHGHNPRVNADRNTYLRLSSTRAHVEYVTLKHDDDDDDNAGRTTNYYCCTAFFSLSRSLDPLTSVAPSTGLGRRRRRRPAE